MTSGLCSGCGAQLQSADEQAPGYLAAGAPLRESPLCRRCYRIRHYGEFPEVTMTIEEQEEQVLKIRQEPGLILYVVDGFDLQGSLVDGLSRYTNEYPVIVVVNKVDLFPKEVKLDRLADWIAKVVENQGVRPRQVVFASAKSGSGIEALVSVIADAAFNQAYVLGMANVGKSTLLNRLLKQLEGEEAFTTSRVPGTTLGLTSVDVALPTGKAVSLVDAPGLLQGNRVTDVLCTDCLRTVLPQARLRPRIFQLNPGQSLWVGGLLRFDFAQGAPQSVVCYVSNDVVIHRTKLERADEFGRDHAEDILKVPCASCRAEFGELEPWQVGAGKYASRLRGGKRAIGLSGSGDLVLPGLGWIALTGRDFLGQVWAPSMMRVESRPRLIGVLTQAPPRNRRARN
ncbi:MAG: ribosome biogenesis GTPase YqeH [Alicyclobacillus sp. RIFOXYA1_FULL_53_8]|nr:MAG: ribosome biogenesis GTPase YqeH [Alicyclobacillus sp. RIFOXYA1_FULL_53_8]